MTDTTATFFHDFVYTWNYSDFNFDGGFGGTSSFTVNSGVTPSKMFIDGVDGYPALATASNANFISNSYVVNDAEQYITKVDGEWEYNRPDLSNASTINVEEIIDIQIGDGENDKFWVAHVTGTDNEGNAFDTYVSNHTLRPGETYNVLGIDTSPNGTGEEGSYSSIFGELRSDFAASPTGPDSFDADGGYFGGSRTLAAWQFDDVVTGREEGSTFSVSSTAEQGKFVSYDNDEYINDGNANYSAYFNDTSQVGDYILPDGTVKAEGIIYQAESGYWLEDPITGEKFQVALITFGDTDGANGSLYFSETPLQPGVDYKVLAFYDGTPGVDNANIPDEWETSFRYSELVKCYTFGTSIATKDGDVDIENIKAGDLLKTADGEFKPVRWIDSRTYTKAELEANPNLYPVVITAGALGNGLPKRDLVVSRQHRMLVRSALTKAMVGTTNAMVPAIKLTELPGIYVDTKVESVSYIHLLLDAHEAIIAEGAPSETLYLGGQSTFTFSEDALEEILEMFPQLGSAEYQFPTTYALHDGKSAKKIVNAHMRKNAALYE